MEPHYFHYATKGLQDDVLFENSEAYIAGMNRVATCYIMCCSKHPVKIFAFCLMDNHVHFILYGIEEDCSYFMVLFKRLTEIWLVNHPSSGRSHKNWDIGHWLIKDKEALIEKINYVHRNPTVAGLPYTPYGYPWSTGGLIYTDLSNIKLTCKEMGSLSIREKKQYFNTHIDYPDNWMILPTGVIWPGNYVEYKRVENIFSSASRYMYELNKRVEETVNIEMLSDNISLPDGEIREKAKKAANEMYDTSIINELSIKQRAVIGKQLHREYGASIKQLSRILGIKCDDLKLII